MSWKPRPAAQHSGGSVEEALAGMAKVGAPREPMGEAVVFGTRNASADVSTPTKPRNNRESGDPTIMDAANRSNVAYDRMGAHYGIQASLSMPDMTGYAGATTRNGRLMGAATVRSGFRQESGGW